MTHTIKEMFIRNIVIANRKMQDERLNDIEFFLETCYMIEEAEERLKTQDSLIFITVES
jgi:hypothetical protein